MKIDWQKKLSSRKFWAAAAGFVSALLVVFGASDLTNTQVTGIVTAAGVLVAYILGESYVDGQKTPENREETVL